uniref:Uncharacterized protein n=1 Tax=Sipha flava TaxID=143950 RepID=A0A2S2QA10_9HEMI
MRAGGAKRYLRAPSRLRGTGATVNVVTGNGNNNNGIDIRLSLGGGPGNNKTRNDDGTRRDVPDEGESERFGPDRVPAAGRGVSGPPGLRHALTVSEKWRSADI